MQESLEKLQTLLQQLFRADAADLDFWYLPHHQLSTQPDSKFH